MRSVDVSFRTTQGRFLRVYACLRNTKLTTNNLWQRQQPKPVSIRGTAAIWHRQQTTRVLFGLPTYAVLHDKQISQNVMWAHHFRWVVTKTAGGCFLKFIDTSSYPLNRTTVGNLMTTCTCSCAHYRPADWREKQFEQKLYRKFPHTFYDQDTFSTCFLEWICSSHEKTRRASRDGCVMPTFDNMLILMTHLKVLLQHKGEGEQTDIEVRRYAWRNKGRSVATSKAESQWSNINTVSKAVRKVESSWTAVGRYAISANVIQLPLMSSVVQMMGKAKER